MAGRAVAAATLRRLLPSLGQASAQQSTLAALSEAAQPAVAPVASAAAPAAAQARSFYKRQLPRELVAFSSPEARCTPPRPRRAPR